MKAENAREELSSAIASAMRRTAPDRLHEEFFGKELEFGALDRYERVFAIAVGKCARLSATGMSSALGSRLSEVVVVDAAPDRADERHLHLKADHPLPGQSSERAVHDLIRTIAEWRLTERDLVVVSVSGGTSAMLAAPAPPLNVEDLGTVSRLLLTSGLDVTEVNRLRRRLSILHDGRLSGRLRPASVWTLLQIDNAQGALSAVGSGPTLPEVADSTGLPLSILTGLAPELAEKVGRARQDPYVGRGPNDRVVELSSIPMLGQALRSALEQERITVADWVAPFGGSWEGARDWLASALKSALANGRGGERPIAVFACGEVTVDVPEGEDRAGGRCQHVALSLWDTVAEFCDAESVCFATDGCDNLAGVQGARISTSMTKANSRGSVELAISTFRSGILLEQLGGLIKGPRSGQNLCDIYALVVYPDGWP